MSGATTLKLKRFYKDVSIAPIEQGFSVLLDGRAAKTKSKTILSMPTEAMAQALAAEWKAQDEHIDPALMPLTTLVSTAIDADDESVLFWRDEVVKFLGTDLLCYRADVPKELADAQAAGWDQYLDWFAGEFESHLRTTTGVAAIDQPDAAINAVRELVDGATPLEALVFFKATGITGSAVLALALWKRAFDVEKLFTASRVDEKFQAQRWGVDVEAQMREYNLYKELLAIDGALELLIRSD